MNTELCLPGSIPSVDETISTFCGLPMVYMACASFVVALWPLPRWMYLGNQGEPLLAIVAPLMVFLCTGLVVVSWWILSSLVWVLSKVFARCAAFLFLRVKSGWELILSTGSLSPTSRRTVGRV